MRIGIDARSLHYEGVGRYIREFINYISKIDRHNEFIIYFSSDKDRKENSINQSNFHNTLLPVTIYDVHKQPYVYYRLSKDNLDIFHATDHWLVPFFSPCPIVTTVHDTLVKTARSILPFKVLLYGSVIARIAMSVSDRIIAISDFAKKEIINYYPKTMGKISVIYQGVGPEFMPVSALEILRVKEKYLIKKKYLLYVGSLKNHKNVPRLIEAFSKLSNPLIQRTELIIAARLESRFSVILKLITQLGVENSVKTVGYVSTRDLPGLYCGADALILPSLTENFGLPLVEAMACGVPIIASKVGSIQEVAGNSAIYFNSESVDEIKNVIEQVLSDEGLRKMLSHRGLKRSKEFSWDVTARKTLDIYEDVYTKRVHV